MKMLGNALLSAAIISAPALAEDVKRHSEVLNKSYWKPSTLATIQERGRSEMPKIVDDVAPCSPSDVVPPRGGMFGERVLTLQETIDARYHKIDNMLSIYDRSKNGKSQDRQEQIEQAIRYEILQLKLADEDVFSRYEKKGGDSYKNLTTYIMGMSDNEMIPMLSSPAGVNDYVTGKPLNVGQIMLGGCIVAMPDEPERAIAYEVNGNINNVNVGEFKRLLRSDVADVFVSKYNSIDHFAYASNFNTGAANGHSYVHLDTFKYSDAHTLDTFFHELKHVHSEDRMKILTKSGNATDYHTDNMEIEVRGVIYGMAKVGQHIYKEFGEHAFVEHVDRAIRFHTEAVLEESVDIMRLRKALVSSDVRVDVADVLENQRLIRTFNSEELCKSLIGNEDRTQKAVNECLFRIKNPYNPVVALEVFKDVIVEQGVALDELSDKELDALVNDTVSSSMLIMENDISMSNPVIQGIGDRDLLAYAKQAKDVFYEMTTQFGHNPSKETIAKEKPDEIDFSL